MWDWKQILWMKCFGWDVYRTEKGITGHFLKLEGLIFFWMMLVTAVNHIVFLILSINNGDYKDIIPCISECATAIRGSIKCIKWTFRGSEITTIIRDIEDLDKRRAVYFKDRDKTYCESVMSAHTNLCSTYFYLSIASILGTVHWTIRPIVSATHGDYIQVLHDWVPWDDGVFAGWLVHYFTDALVCLSCISGYLSFDTLVLAFNEMTLALVKSVAHGFSTLNFESGSVRRDLKELHEMHKDVLKITRKVNNFSNWAFQIDCLLLTFTTCCAVLELTVGWSSLHRKVNIIELIWVCGLFFYLQCHRCEMITKACSDVALAAFDNYWYVGSREDIKTLSIVVGMSRKPVKFGSIIRIDLSTFIAVIKTSFSYYNVLAALNIH